MNSSSQKKSTRRPASAPKKNPMTGPRPSRLTVVEQEVMVEAVREFHLAAGRQNKLQALQAYRDLCRRAKIEPVSGVTFIRQLKDLPRPTQTQVLDVAPIIQDIAVKIYGEGLA